MKGVFFGAMIALSGVGLNAADVTLTASDAFGATSFNVAGNWNNAAAPAPENDYFTGVFSLRTPHEIASPFTFQGNSLTLQSAGVLSYKGAGSQTITINNLIMAGGTVFVGSANRTMRLDGPITLATLGGTFSSSTDSSDRTLEVLGSLSGSGPLSMGGNGTIRLVGGAITYTGPTTLNGRLELQNTTAFQSAIATGTRPLVLSSTANWTLPSTTSISGGGSITQTGTHTITLASNNSAFTGSIVVNAGRLRLPSLTAFGDSVTGTTINGGNSTGGNWLELAFGGGMVNEPLFLNGNAAGRAGVSNVNGVTTLAGPIVVNAVNNHVQFWSESGSTLHITGNITGTIAAGSPVLFFRGDGPGTVTGDVNLTAGTVAKTETSTWTIGAPGKTYNWTHYGNLLGTTVMGAESVLPAASTLGVGQNDGGNATFDLNGFNQTVAGISATLGSGGTKQITSATGAATLTVNNAGANTFSARFAGADLSVHKTGAGTLTLQGINIHGGSTIVDAGILRLANATSFNNLASSSLIDVRTGGTLDVTGLLGSAISLTNGQTLKGAGTVSGGLIVASGSTVSPGASPGLLTTDSQEWNEGGTYLFELDKVTTLSLSQASLRGLNDGADAMDIAGTLTLTSTPLNPFTVKIAGLQLDDSPGMVDGWDPNGNFVWNIAAATSGILGFAPGSVIVDTSDFVSNNSIGAGREFFITTDAQTVFLNYGVIPEPSSFLLLVLGGALVRRFRLRSAGF